MKKEVLSKIVAFVVMAAIGGSVGFFIAKVGLNSANQLPKGVLVSLGLMVIPTFFLVIAVHEAGHAIAGVWMKFEFRMMVVGPFLWEKEPAGWKFKWNKNVNTSGGLVICLPMGNENLIKRFSVYLAGGPLASLVLAGIGYTGYVFLGSMQDQAVLQGLRYFSMLMAWLSMAIFVITIIPMQVGGFSTDGGRLLRIQRGGEAARFEIMLLKIISTSTGGIRPRLWVQEELQEAFTLAKKLDAPFSVYLHSFFHQAAFDKGDMDAAEQHLKNYMEEAHKIPDGIRNSVWLDAAFFYAFARRDLATAEQYWNKFSPSALIPKAQIFATEAAIRMLKQESATDKIDAAIKELPAMLDRGVSVALHDRLLEMKQSVAWVQQPTPSLHVS